MNERVRKEADDSGALRAPDWREESIIA